MRLTIVLALLAMPLAPARADRPPIAGEAAASLQAHVESILAQAPIGTRFGLMVTTMEGAPLIAIAPDQRFMPASNTKMVTTAAAYARLAALDGAARGTGVRLERGTGGTVDVVLVGRGDPRLSGAGDCARDCLATLADAVAAKVRHVRHVIGDDSLFPDERWSPGMSWNNIQTRSGTGISALTLDDNELSATVSPAGIGEAPVVRGADYYRIDNRATTVPGHADRLGWRRGPNEDVLRIIGTIGRDAPPRRLRFGVDDPARYAAWRLRALLEARGVRVGGAVQVRHRPLMPADDPAVRGGAPAAMPPEPEMLAELRAQPIAEDIAIINKQSQNLHAELLLRRLARLDGSGSIADGLAALRAMLVQAGVTDNGVDLSDGSGMSTYNRITPRAAVTLLGWIARQPWGEQWRETLPVGGRDGTLRRRFAGTALEGRIFAKTGSLYASNALTGYFVARSGEMLVFSLFANDAPDAEAPTVVDVMDRAILAITEVR